MSFKKNGFKSKNMSEAIFSKRIDLEEEMKRFFEERTNKHVKLVKEYLTKAAQEYPAIEDILTKRGNEHDASKYRPPEYEPYVHLTWKYKKKSEGSDYEMDEEMAKTCHDITYHHCKQNKHHPEYWDNHLTDNPISFENRDEPSGIVVDATKMDRPSIIEMCCDWCSVATERKTDPSRWAKDNINKRWRFTPNQEKFIYEVIEKLWHVEEEKEETYIHEINEVFLEELMIFCEDAEVKELEKKVQKLRRMVHTASPKEKEFLRKGIEVLSRKISKSQSKTGKISFSDKFDVILDWGKSEDLLVTPDNFYKNPEYPDSVVFLYFPHAQRDRDKLVYSTAKDGTHVDLISDIVNDGESWEEQLSSKTFQKFVGKLWDEDGKFLPDQDTNDIVTTIADEMEDEIITGRTDGKSAVSIWNGDFLKDTTKKKQLEEMMMAISDTHHPAEKLYVPDKL